MPAERTLDISALRPQLAVQPLDSQPAGTGLSVPQVGHDPRRLTPPEMRPAARATQLDQRHLGCDVSTETLPGLQRLVDQGETFVRSALVEGGLAGDAMVMQGLGPQLGRRGVVARAFGQFGIATLLDRREQAGMELAAPALEEALIHRVLHERLAEVISCAIAAEQDSDGAKLPKCAAQLRVGPV